MKSQHHITASMASASAVLFVIMFSAIFGLGSAAQNRNMASQSTGPAPTPLPVCIDDSDCEKLREGNKYACFQYLCYPWKNDSHIQKQFKRRTCRKDGDCDAGQECFRHHDKRTITRGLCFDEVKSCQAANDCSKGYQCCGGNCCEQEYYRQFATLPCISDLGCKDLGLGKFCCPQGPGKQSQCCNVDPNPPTTVVPLAVGSAFTVKFATAALVPLVLAIVGLN